MQSQFNLELKKAAFEYWQKGLAVVPIVFVKEADGKTRKQPLIDWSGLLERKQSLQDFETLPWDKAVGFALIGGAKTNDSLYVGAVDYDVKNVDEEARERGRAVLKALPITQIEETPSKGQHWIYYCRKQPTTIETHHNTCAVELLGKNHLIVMAPSLGYRRLNDNTPTVIEDLQATFHHALEQAGIKTEKSSPVWFDQPELCKQPYRGRDPPCILSLLRGTTEGSRNEYGIRLASYYVNFRQYQPKTVREDILKGWNRLNTPPIPSKELDAIVKSAVQGKYVYGCTDPILKSLCNIEKCPIAPKQIAKLLTPEERERAERLLADPKLLDYIVQYGRRRLIGEDNILLTNFVIICSGQTKYPISGVASGYSGVGKNESIRAVKPLIPNEWIFEFTTSTPEAVKYIPEDFAGTLVIYEIVGVESKTGTLGLRSVGEGESIETIFPMRDEETGKMMLGRHKTNARNFITTESDIGIHPDLYRRVLKLSLNDSDVLTRRVLGKKLRDAMFPEGLRKKLGYDVSSKIPYSEKDFQNALRLLDWSVEVVVFPPANMLQLLDLAQKKEQKVALRSQVDRILNFIRVLAIIHQKQRLWLEDVKDGYRAVIASPGDFENAMRVLAPSIVETVSRLEKRQQEALEKIKEASGEMWNKDKLAQKLGVSTKTAARILKSLANLGYLTEVQTTKPYSYQLSEAEEKPKHLDLLKNIREYRLFYEKELNSFLTRIWTPGQNLRVRGVLNQGEVIRGYEKNTLPGGVCPGVPMPVKPVSVFSGQKEQERLLNSKRSRYSAFSLVYGVCRTLAKDGLVNKFEVADALKDRLARGEVFRLLAELEKEGKLAAKGAEWYIVN